MLFSFLDEYIRMELPENFDIEQMISVVIWIEPLSNKTLALEANAKDAGKGVETGHTQ